MDQRNCAIEGYALDTLCNITAPENFENGECFTLFEACST